MTLSDAYQKDANGEVVINPMVKRIYLDRQRRDWNDDTLSYVRRRVRHLNTTMHGNYGAQAKAEIERYITGRYLLQLRKWMLQGARRRWGMSPYKFSQQGDIPWYDRDITLPDNELGEYFEGIFITFGRHLSKQMVDLAWSPLVMFGASNRNSVRGNWRQLDEWEQANFKKATIELAMANILTAAFVNLLAWAFEGDDEDEDFLAWAQDVFYYTSYRMRIELALYYNPTALLDIMKSPFVGVSAASQAVEFLGQLLTDIWGTITLQGPETYTHGSRKGQWKLRKKFLDLIPGFRAGQSILSVKDKIVYQNLNRG